MAVFKHLFLSLFCLLGTIEVAAAPTIAAYDLSLEPQARLYHSQDRSVLGSTIRESIMQAQDSILIFTFSLSDPGVLQALKQKVEDGVQVTVIIDREHMGEIKRVPGVEIVTRLKGEGHLHHKILVIDRQEIWIGSANFTTSAYTTQENLMTRFLSRELGEYLHNEADAFRGIAQRIGHGPLLIPLKDQDLFFCLLPHDGFPPKKTEKAINDQSKEFLLEKIRQARSTIKIAMMVWTNNDLAKAVIDAHKRGVKVQIIAPDLGGNMQSLKNAGIEVRINPKLGFMHNKLMCVDDTILVNGSANWSQSSFTRSDESFVILDPMTDVQTLVFDEYWNFLYGKL